MLRLIAEQFKFKPQKENDGCNDEQEKDSKHGDVAFLFVYCSTSGIRAG